MMYPNKNKYRLEKYIQDWYWDERSYKLAKKMGQFLFRFLDYVAMSGASERVLRKENSNIWNVGILSCQYGYHEQFSPNIFDSPPFHLIEFKRKVSDTPYAVQSYLSSCKKLSKYVKNKVYLDQETFDFELSDEIDDFCIGLRFLENKSGRGKKNEAVTDFSPEIKTLQKNFVRELSEVSSQEELLERLGRCVSVLETIVRQIGALKLGDNQIHGRIAPELAKDAPELKERIEFLMAMV